MKQAILLLPFLAAFAACGQTAPVSHSGTDSVAFDTIAGDLPARLAPGNHPYFVAGDIYVPQGKTVEIAAGTVLCFKNFTGLHVQGTLVAKGIKNNPIVFTSEHDKEYHKQSAVDPAPYDWNGIYIHEDAIGTQLSYCAVMYSVDGINSLTKYFQLSPCIFLHNGRANLTVQGAQYQVTEEPFVYSLTLRDAAAASPPITELKDPLAPTRNTLRYSGAAMAAIGFFVAVVTGTQYASSQHAFSALSSTSPDNLAQGTSAAWEAARNKKNNDFADFITSCAVAGVGAVGICWSLKF